MVNNFKVIISEGQIDKQLESNLEPCFEGQPLFPVLQKKNSRFLDGKMTIFQSADISIMAGHRHKTCNNVECNQNALLE